MLISHQFQRYYIVLYDTDTTFQIQCIWNVENTKKYGFKKNCFTVFIHMAVIFALSTEVFNILIATVTVFTVAFTLFTVSPITDFHYVSCVIHC